MAGTTKRGHMTIAPDALKVKRTLLSILPPVYEICQVFVVFIPPPSTSMKLSGHIDLDLFIHLSDHLPPPPCPPPPQTSMKLRGHIDLDLFVHLSDHLSDRKAFWRLGQEPIC